jgi:hypothetical protein
MIRLITTKQLNSAPTMPPRCPRLLKRGSGRGIGPLFAMCITLTLPELAGKVPPALCALAVQIK